MLKFFYNKTGGYRLITWIMTILSFFVPFASHAVVSDTGIDTTASIAGLKPAADTTIPQVIGTLLGAVLSLLGVVALALIIYGGFRWMTAAGNEEDIKKAKNILTSSIVGLVIIVTAYVVVNFVVTNILRASGVTG